MRSAPRACDRHPRARGEAPARRCAAPGSRPEQPLARGLVGQFRPAAGVQAVARSRGRAPIRAQRGHSRAARPAPARASGVAAGRRAGGLKGRGPGPEHVQDGAGAGPVRSLPAPCRVAGGPIRFGRRRAVLGRPRPQRLADLLAGGGRAGGAVAGLADVPETAEPPQPCRCQCARTGSRWCGPCRGAQRPRGRGTPTARSARAAATRSGSSRSCSTTVTGQARDVQGGRLGADVVGAGPARMLGFPGRRTGGRGTSGG